MSAEEQTDRCLYQKELKARQDSDVRGSLKLEASTSTPITSAGEEISIYVVIRNPFSVPVRILSTETHIPVDITDQLAQKRYRKKIKESRKNILQEIVNSQHLSLFQKILKHNLLKFRFLLTDIFQSFLAFEFFQILPVLKIFQIESDERVAIAVSPDEEESGEVLRYFEKPIVNLYQSNGDVNALLTNGIILNAYQPNGDINISTGDRGDTNLSVQEESNLAIENGANFTRLSDRAGITLYPGDSLVKHFVLKTRKWLFFNPVSHTFQIQVRYRIDDRYHIDTLPFSVDIRAPMRASIIGAIIGSILGSIVSESRKNIDLSSREFWLSLSRTTIFALIIIVAFARKSNVQQVVSVEDFWGGLFTGFLVGYSGDSFIKSILGGGNSGNIEGK